MGTASSGEWIAILLYFALVIGVGVYFFIRDPGVEVEIRKNLFVRPVSNAAHGMNKLSLGLNGSYIYTNAKMPLALSSDLTAKITKISIHQMSSLYLL